MRTRFCETNLRERIRKTSTYSHFALIWILPCRRNSECNTKMESLGNYSILFSVFIYRSGQHHRHSPQALPLWLLAPRCLWATYQTAQILGKWAVWYFAPLGERKFPLPGSDLLLITGVIVLAIPTLRFSIFLLVCASLLIMHFKITTELIPLATGRHSGKCPRLQNTRACPKCVRLRTHFAHPCVHELTP